MVSGSAVAAMNRRESGKGMQMGFASGSVFPLPTANSHAKVEYLIWPAFEKATFPQVEEVLRTCTQVKVAILQY